MKTIYQCEICNRQYSTPEAATVCEELPMRDMKQGSFLDGAKVHEPWVGDIVECSYPATSWWRGDEAWRVHRERGGRFLDGFYALWIVVAKIPADNRHEWRYILWSPSNIVDKECMCWTGPGHTQMYAHGKATEEQLALAQAAYDKVPRKDRIELL